MKDKIIIGNTTVPNIWLAPMAGDGDRAFRLICKEHGASYLCSEMVSAKAICYGDSKTPLLCEITREELPMAIQIFGAEPEFMAKAAAMILEQSAKRNVLPSAIDINMGCPVNKIVSNGEGSALMKNPELAAAIVRAVSAAIAPYPVTVKTRLGWDCNSINVVDFAKRLEEAGAKAICVHARTRSQLYSPGVDISYIKKVKESVSVPVIGNGDIFHADDAFRMMEETGCDGVAIARGALGNPWIFDEINAKMKGDLFLPPTKKERCKEALKQLKYAARFKGEYTAIVESRKYISQYTKGMQGSSHIRQELNSADSLEQIEKLLEKLAGTALQ